MLRLGISLPFVLALIILRAITSAAQEPPLVPFQTNFSHSEHHWILWTPKHPVYEAVEVRSADNPEAPGGKSIRVFFTERAGAKNQVYYFNEEAITKRWRYQAYYRDIEYVAKGQSGKPLDLFVKFKDKDDQLVELTMRFDEARGLSTEHAGLTDQMGHGADWNFLLFFREKTASITTNKLLIGGEDFSITPEQARGTQLFIRSGYRFNIYVATVAYTKSRFTWNQDELTASFKRTFRRVSASENEITYRSNLSEDKNLIELVTNPKGEIRIYKQILGPHIFRIEFDPALPTIKSAKPDRSVNYRISLDNFSNLVEGAVLVRRDQDSIQLDWQHQTPTWTRDYHFTSIIRPNPAGYDLEVVRKRKNL